MNEHPIARDPFQEIGTELLLSPAELKERLRGIRALLFDWDGVFNDGWKDLEGGSPFSEVGSMGVNMLRFGLWLQNGEQIPYSAIITGQHNAHAERFAQREKMHGLYMGFIDKRVAFEAFLAKHGLKVEEVVFFFDDAIDLAVADRCGVRVLMRGQAGEFFVKHAVARGCVDLITALSGGQNGLREGTDALLTLMGRFGEAIDHRAAYSDAYQRYLAQRQAVSTEIQRAGR
ncbi:MAG: phosphatase [Flavobacteriales bacterium]|nr:phosphatase [Flavobacteriales bacterium]